MKGQHKVPTEIVTHGKRKSKLESKTEATVQKPDGSFCNNQIESQPN